MAKYRTFSQDINRGLEPSVHPAKGFQESAWDKDRIMLNKVQTALNVDQRKAKAVLIDMMHNPQLVKQRHLAGLPTKDQEEKFRLLQKIVGVEI